MRLIKVIREQRVFPITKREALRLRGVGLMSLKAMTEVGLVRKNPFSTLSKRAQNCLDEMGIESIPELLKTLTTNPCVFENQRNLGRKTFTEICEFCHVLPL